MLYDGDEFEHNGREFKVRFPYDEDGGYPPWDRDCCTGVVSGWTSRTTRDKRPGERILHEDHGSRRYYDWQATMEKAWADGWGLSDAETAKLETKLKRKPAKGDIIAAAVEADFQRLRAWCRDDWHYVVIEVTDLETGEKDYLGGVESDAGAYLEECAREMADQLNHAHDERVAAKIEAGPVAMAMSLTTAQD